MFPVNKSLRAQNSYSNRRIFYLCFLSHHHFSEVDSVKNHHHTSSPEDSLSDVLSGQFFDLEIKNTCSIPISLNDLIKAWLCMWHNGLFPNPEQIDLNLDTRQRPPLKWCLTIANIWSDLFLRRVAVFAMALLGDLVQEENKAKRSLSDKFDESVVYTGSNGHISGIRSFDVTHQDETDSGIKDGDMNGLPSDSRDPLLTWDDMLWIAKVS
ncbi:unnamed protein product [Trichobilharzia szidati]|nr:unnamed protein product [Trichobilharzia szidati]